MSSHSGPKHRPSHDEEHPETAADEVLHEAEEAETRIGDNERRGQDREAADALTPNEDAQEDVQKPGA